MITQIVSFDGTAFSPDYEVGFVGGSEPRLPPAEVEMLERIGAYPVIVALQRKPHRLALIVRIAGSSRDTLRSALFRLFDPTRGAGASKTLVAQNHAGIAMSVACVCEDFRVYGDQQHDTAFVATLAVDGDVRWRATTATVDTWSITATGQTHTLNNTGEDEAYPILDVTPTSTKTGGYAYKRYALVTWRAINPGSTYSIRLGPLDTATLVGAGKVQADGDDLRVFVDGIEAWRGLVAMNDANTYIWFNANYQKAPTLELAASIAGAGSVDTIQLDDADEMALLPSQGFVRVGSEVFSYTARDLVGLRLTGVTRAAWGTSAGAHSAADDVFWMQHEVIVAYGNATAAAPAASTASTPVFTLASSSNTSWYFENFGQKAISRPAAWAAWGNVTTSGGGGVYTGTQRTLSTLYSVIGAWLSSLSGNAYGWNLYNPCGIVNAAWAGGKKRAPVVTDFLVHLMYWVRGDPWWTWQATLADPLLANTWENWSEAAAVSDWEPADTLAIAAYFLAQDVEVGTVTVSLNSDETPVVSIGSEIGNYTVAATITNQTTGDAITVAFDMPLNQTLEINTDEKTVTNEADGSNQFQAVGRNTARSAWLPLLPGNNVLRFDDTGTAAVTVTITYQRRYY